MAKNRPQNKGFNTGRQNYLAPKSIPVTEISKNGQTKDSLLQKINQAIDQLNAGEPVNPAKNKVEPAPVAAAVADIPVVNPNRPPADEPVAGKGRATNASTAPLALPLPGKASGNLSFLEELKELEEDLEAAYEIEQVQTLDNRLKRKEVLVQEQQKKIKSLKQRITRLEEEARNRNRTIASYQSELIHFSKDLEDRTKTIKTLEETVGELRKKVSAGNEAAPLNEKLKLAEKEIAGLRTELKQKQQDLLLVGRDLKESKRVYKELQESFDILLAQNTSLEKQSSDLKRVKEEMDTRYTKTLDNLKAEVRLRQGECSKMLRELQETKKEKEDLERLVDGLELKAEMLSSNNSSLQRKLDKVNRQKGQLEDQINHGLVRFALSLVRLFGRGTDSSSSVSS
ncbi:MAG: hypothetical protein HPY50_01240 [Firmicutes bacterium]|nr:hypothetical protein [Bacillota bacterium]